MKLKTLISVLILSCFFSLNAFAKDAVIEKGKKVSLNYTLTVDGKVVDSSEGKEPLSFTYGEMSLVTGFSKGIEGLKVGDKKSMTITPEDGYGPIDPKAVVEVPRTNFPPEQEIKPGMVFTANGGPAGAPVHGTVKELKGDQVVLDFNHPLAGKTLNFEIAILSIS